jgi:hypothetical protein
MNLNRDQLQKDIHELYAKEHQALGKTGTYQMLDEARKWDLSRTLESGGVLVFPHAGVADCGHQIAAVVNACLDCGADRVLVISVLHAFTDEMEEARIRVAGGESELGQEPLRGIQGPGIAGNEAWRGDHVLISFRHFWEAEIERRGIRGPEVIERYPYLAGGKPYSLPGIDELEVIARDAVVVSTADPFHHGIGYGDSPEESFFPNQGGLEKARESINEGIRLLEEADYWGYNQHCVTAKSDARDAGQVFRYICSPMEGQIIDLVYSEAGELYKAVDPTWVAAALIEWKPV